MSLARPLATFLLDQLGRPASPLRLALQLDSAEEHDLKRTLAVLQDLAPDLPADLEPLRDWAPRVGRYSLYWHAG